MFDFWILLWFGEDESKKLRSRLYLNCIIFINSELRTLLSANFQAGLLPFLSFSGCEPIIGGRKHFYFHICAGGTDLRIANTGHTPLRREKWSPLQTAFCLVFFRRRDWFCIDSILDVSKKAKKPQWDNSWLRAACWTCDSICRGKKQSEFGQVVKYGTHRPQQHKCTRCGGCPGPKVGRGRVRY